MSHKPRQLKYFHRYLPVPKQLVEAEMHSLSGSELKVYLYLLLRTVGWNKITDTPTVEQICSGLRRRDGSIVDMGTGLKRSAVKLAIRSLEKRTWVTVIREHNKPNRYTVSKFLRVTVVTPDPTSDGHVGDPQDGHVGDPVYLQETTKKGADLVMGRIVSMPRTRKA